MSNPNDDSRLDEIEQSVFDANDGRSCGFDQGVDEAPAPQAEETHDELNSGNLGEEGSFTKDPHAKVLDEISVSAIQRVTEMSDTVDATLRNNLTKSTKPQSITTPATPTLPERSESKNSIIKPGSPQDSESVLTKAVQEEEFQREIQELVVRHQQNIEKFVIPAYNEQLKSYDEEMAQIKEDMSHKESREMKSFIERRKQSATKVFEILKRDFDKKIIEVLEDCKTNNSLTPELVKTRNSEIEILYKRLDSRLTVYFKKDEIVQSLQDKRITIVVGAPGCGKSTQIPQMILTEHLLKDPKRTVFMVSPRMAAARKVCDRINDEMGEELCQFHSGEKASIQLATLNFAVDYEFYRRLVITKEVNIEEIEYLIIDEANSKKMYTEVVLSMSRKLMRTHKHLKLVILSTSLNKYELEAFFRSNIDLDVDADDAIAIQESNFKTETIYQTFNGSNEEKINQVLTSIEERILQNLEQSKSKKIRNANILMFLRGASEVRNMYQKFNEWLPDKEGLISLSERLRDLNIRIKYKLFMASGASDMVLDNDMLKPNELSEDGGEVVKLIFSTKVLETSLTIPNLGYVVDFGEEHVYAFDHKLGVETLREQKISNDTAIQRRGRVGRTCKGVCYRLYKEEDLTEEHSMSELCYKKLDLLVLSWIQIALDYRKNKENPFFDMKDSATNCDETNPVEATSDDATQVLSSLMSKFQLTSEIGEESIKKSLDLMKQLSIIEKDSLNKPLGDIYKVVLASGAELCFGKTIYRAILECGGAKDLLEGHSKTPWLLEEVVTMIACNTYNRKIVTEKLPKDLEGKLQELMRTYGDFAHNYEIYKVYDERSGSSAEMQAQVNILRGFANNAHMIRSRIQKLLRLPNGYFKSVREKFRKGTVPDEERYQLLTKCLAFGFAPDISVHINDKIGYYNYRTKQIVQIGADVAFKSESQTPEFMVISDILAQESRFISRFCFKVDMKLIESQFSKIMKHLRTMDRSGLPTKVYERYDLPSELIHSMVYRDFMIKQILDKKKGSIISLSERLMELKVALPEKSEERTKARIESLIGYFEENLRNHTVELFLEGCRVSVGQGLQITDIMTYRETTSFYHFLVPRYINQTTNEVLLDGSQLESSLPIDLQVKQGETPDISVGHWDFLLYHYKKYFGIGDKETRCETTVSKVNYNAGPQMNLKLSFKTLADMEFVREEVKKKQLSLDFSTNSIAKKCEVKFYDKQLYTNNLGNIMKPLILGVMLFTKQNLGSCTIKRLSTIEVDQVAKAIREQKTVPGSIFGSNLQVTSDKTTVTLTGLPQQLDEYSIYKFLMGKPNLIKFSDPEIEMRKPPSNGSNHTDSKEKYKDALIDLIDTMIDEKRQSLGPDEQFPNDFMCSPCWKYSREYDGMVEIQVRVTSYQLVELIKDKLDGKYYNSSFVIEGEKPSYKLGVAYTHVEEYDRPEFYTQKSAFTKFQPFIDDLNKSIREEIEKRQPTNQLQGKGARDTIRKDLTEVRYPEKDHLERLKHDENIRIEIKKGANRDIADQAERILTSYFAGKEFLIAPEQYSFWFGGEGKKFIEALKGSQQAQDEYAIIQSIPNRSLVVLKALHNSLQKTSGKETIEEQIQAKIEALESRKNASIYLKVTLREIAMLQKSAGFKSIKKKYNEDTISTFTNYGGLVVIETKSEERAKTIKDDVEKEIKNIRESQKNVNEFEKVECSICGERGNIQRLLLCRHQYCYLCLQQSIFKSIVKAEKKVESDPRPNIREPYVFCPHPNCSEPISSCDIFKVLSENLITDKMKKIVAKVLSNPLNTRHMIRCGTCGTYNRNREGAKNKPSLCLRCNNKSN